MLFRLHMSFTSLSLRKTHIDSLLFFYYDILFYLFIFFYYRFSCSFRLRPVWLTKHHRRLLLDSTTP
ncbi:hypothetical protein BDV35DRAFT_358340 [Aspergillus flavus]|uniref:Uncharacterized protein n=1 Tax=Aspergillus flavus TaxID=5059 RepID=A0A5N6GX81_ASPFL|nr:hypothetical protein BDV35DRAFT_358340 [Aspergillus flavus]